MTYRRNDFDVTNRVNTTDPVSVREEVCRLHRAAYRAPAPALARAFDDVAALYRGERDGYFRCDTAYHDLQHVLEVALAMARLLDGYERSRGDGPPIGSRLFQFGVVCALFHDVGYLRRRGDRLHRRGAEYTRSHVTRGGRFLRAYLPTVGMEEFASVAGQILHFTGYEKAVSTIRLRQRIFRLLGSLLGSADIIAQMSDRCYLFESPEDLIRKTPRFFQGATKRLDGDLDGAYRYVMAHFGGADVYMDAVRRNVTFAERLVGGPDLVLRRVPPASAK
jgi:hypothetical protein